MTRRDAAVRLEPAVSTDYQATTVTRLRIDGMSKEEDYTHGGEVSPVADTLHLDKAIDTPTVYLPPPR